MLIACDNQNEVHDKDNVEFYELRSINTGLSGQIIEKEDLDFTEYIEFFNDSTFVKQRIYQDSTSTAKGRFSYYDDNDYDYLKLTYSKDTYLIQSCEKTLIEYLRILNENEIFNGSYLPCDGPGYFYLKKKK